MADKMTREQVEKALMDQARYGGAGDATADLATALGVGRMLGPMGSAVTAMGGQQWGERDPNTNYLDPSSTIGGPTNLAVVPAAVKAARAKIKWDNRRPQNINPDVQRRANRIVEMFFNRGGDKKVKPAQDYSSTPQQVKTKPSSMDLFTNQFAPYDKTEVLSKTPIHNPLRTPEITENRALKHLLGSREGDILGNAAYTQGNPILRKFARTTDLKLLRRYGYNQKDLDQALKAKYPGLALRTILIDKVLNSKGYDSLMGNKYGGAHFVSGTRLKPGAQDLLDDPRLSTKDIFKTSEPRLYPKTNPYKPRKIEIPNTDLHPKADSVKKGK